MTLWYIVSFQAEQESKQKDKNIEQLNEELQQQDEAIAKISKAKKGVEEQCQVRIIQERSVSDLKFLLLLVLIVTGTLF